MDVMPLPGMGGYKKKGAAGSEKLGTGVGKIGGGML